MRDAFDAIAAAPSAEEAARRFGEAVTIEGEPVIRDRKRFTLIADTAENRVRLAENAELASRLQKLPLALQWWR